MQYGTWKKNKNKRNQKVFCFENSVFSLRTD